MTMEQELKQQQRSHPATPRQEPGQSSLLQIRQFVQEHRHQEASTQTCGCRRQRERIHRMEHKGMQKTQNKGSTSNPTVAAAESLRMMLRCVAIRQQQMGTDRNSEKNAVTHAGCDQ